MGLKWRGVIRRGACGKPRGLGNAPVQPWQPEAAPSPRAEPGHVGVPAVRETARPASSLPPEVGLQGPQAQAGDQAAAGRAEAGERLGRVGAADRATQAGRGRAAGPRESAQAGGEAQDGPLAPGGATATSRAPAATWIAAVRLQGLLRRDVQRPRPHGGDG